MMRSSLSAFRSILLIGLTLSVSGEAFGQQDDGNVEATANSSGVVVRLIRDDPAPRLVAWLAANAKPTTLTQGGYPTLPTLSAQEVGKKLCGVPTTEYWRSFRSLNQLPDTFLLNSALGTGGYSYQWPACFFFERGDFTQTIREGMFLGDVYLRETGSIGVKSTHSKFFQGSGIKNIDAVPTGQVVRYTFRTRPVVVVPLGDAAEFMKKLQSEAKAVSGSASSPITPPDEAASVENGEIILAAAGSTDGAIANAGQPPECKNVVGVPFDIARVSAAYRFARSGDAQNTAVRVFIADNGFFGATRIDSRYSFRPLFDKRFFHIGSEPITQRSIIGPSLTFRSDRSLQPLNFENGFQSDTMPTDESGHGTHVTALAIGGPVRTDPVFFGLEEGFWMQASLAAFSPGQRNIPSASAEQFAEVLRRMSFGLDRPAVVNMSLTFGIAAKPHFVSLFQNNLNTLFVVAAGNDGKDLNDADARVFPAALGTASNVLTVAAEDGLGRLTAFSNFGSGVVDIAAPGCNIESTLDGLTTRRLSGTSQAAPIVTFAAALLSRLSLQPDRLKRRIVLSGDLIKSVTVRSPDGSYALGEVTNSTHPIRSRSRLNIAKALYKDFDYLRYRKGDRTFEVLGILGPRTGPRCGDPTWKFESVVAFKREAPGAQAWCFWKDQLAPRAIETTSVFALDFEVKKRIEPNGAIVPYVDDISGLRLDDVDEFVMSEKNVYFHL